MKAGSGSDWNLEGNSGNFAVLGMKAKDERNEKEREQSERNSPEVGNPDSINLYTHTARCGWRDFL